MPLTTMLLAVAQKHHEAIKPRLSIHWRSLSHVIGTIGAGDY